MTHKDIGSYAYESLLNYADALLDAINAHPSGDEIKNTPAVVDAYEAFNLRVEKYLKRKIGRLKQKELSDD